MKIQNMALSLLFGACLTATAQPTAFTYQGQFNDGGSPATERYDFSFQLFDAVTNGAQVGSTVFETNIVVSNGLFTVQVDFGSAPFDGAPLWMQIGARTNGLVNNYRFLSPRQPITSTPYALYASSAPLSSTLASNVALLNAAQTFTSQDDFEARVGIGTNGPLAPLHVTSPGFPTALIDGSSIFGTWMDLRNTSGGTNWLIISSGSGNGEGPAKLLFETGSTPVASTVIAMTLSTTGVTVYGTFDNNSDRNAKQDINPVTPSTILEKVSQLPVSEWSYKVDAATRHIGPMAQDFYSTFKIGTDDKHIAPIDEGGIALAAIQALNVKLEKQAAEIAQLRQELEQTKAAQRAK
jgi:hypothetical protein